MFPQESRTGSEQHEGEWMIHFMNSSLRELIIRASEDHKIVSFQMKHANIVTTSHLSVSLSKASSNDLEDMETHSNGLHPKETLLLDNYI